MLPLISFEGSIPCIRWSSASGEQVSLTPPQVANWIYQALVDVTSELNKLLGSADFDKHGNPKGDGKGEVLLWWGSHLGSARDQGLIAWDYDADLAVVHVPGCDVQQVWRSAKKSLEILGYRCTQHGNKYRVGPCDPIMCWAPYKELYQHVRERQPLASRPDVMRMTAKQWKEGKKAISPHANCVDIEMYEVSPNNAVKVRGTTAFSLALQHLFPTASGVFGPLRFRVPSTVKVLTQEYGPDCMSVRKVKTLTKNGSVGKSVQIPHDCRHSIWPCVPLQRCTAF